MTLLKIGSAVCLWKLKKGLCNCTLCFCYVSFFVCYLISHFYVLLCSANCFFCSLLFLLVLTLLLFSSYSCLYHHFMSTSCLPSLTLNLYIPVPFLSVSFLLGCTFCLFHICMFCFVSNCINFFFNYKLL